MNTALMILLALILLGMAYIRFAPSDPAKWNVDPLTASDPERRGVLMVPPASPVYAMPPEELMAAFDKVALGAPRTKRIAGSVAEGQATYVARTRMLAFPDYITVRTVPEGDGATLAVLSRQRFGGYDWGVNGKRLQRWLARMPSPEN